MLTVKMGGKAVSTTNNKQVMNINGNDVEIERIGNAIYVNGISINVIIAEKVSSIKKKVFVLGIILTGAAMVYFIMPHFDVIFDFVSTQSLPIIEWVMGYVS